MTISDVRYRLHVELTDQGARVRTELTFSSDDPQASAQLSAARIHSVTLNDKSIDALDLRNLDTDKRNILRTDAEIAFSDDDEGLLAFDGEDGRFVHTRLQNRAASRLFCCFPDAGRVQSLALRIVAPRDWAVVSHTPAREDADGAWSFRFDIPLPPHALTFAAGPWSRHGDLYARSSVAHRLALTPIGPDLDAVIEHHGRVLGVPYPHEQRAVVFIPSFKQLGGYCAGLWCLHEDLIRERSRRQTLWAVAHEAAHTWFAGVTDSEAPRETWLMEGFSTYLGHRAMVEIAPELEPWAAFHVLEESSAHDADAGPDAHPIARMPEPPRGKPALVYSKPAAVFRQLDDQVVDAALHRLLTEHVFDRATTADLIECLGPDLERWATQWLLEPGVDTVGVDVQVAAHDVVEDAAVVVDGIRTHALTLRVFDDDITGELVERTPIDLVVAGPSTPITELRDTPRPALILPNAPPRTYAIVRLDERSLSAIAAHLSELDADARAVSWVAARRQLDVAAMRDLIQRHADAEPDPWIRPTIQSWAW